MLKALIIATLSSSLAAAFPSRKCCFAAGGFGKSVNQGGKTRGNRSTAPKTDQLLSSKAKRLLKKHKNDVDAASAEYFQSQIQTGNGEGGDLQEVPHSERLHAARIAASWNTIALFLPLDYARTNGKVDPEVDRRMKLIASSCLLTGPVLDVGCGDGATVSYLLEQSAEASNGAWKYVGIDLSTEMIDLAKKRGYDRSRLTFLVGGFPESIHGTGLPVETGYATILFNGSLQFFRDTNFALAEASRLLCPGGRIILSHVQGGDFVKDECRKNPSIAVRNMPNKISLNMLADELGLRLLQREELLKECQYDPKLDGKGDKFYLCALQKNSGSH